MKQILITSFIFFSFLVSNYGQSLSKEQRKSHYNIKKSIGISGYDPVSYFDNGNPIKGLKTISSSYNGVIYYFANETNKQLFMKNAIKFEPVYGGWCAYAMGKDGSKVSIDPKTYKIIDNRLYLFYNKLGTNTLTLWNKDEKSFKSKADNYWKNTTK